jgi:putative transposase
VGTTPIVKIAGRGWKKVSAVGVLTLSPGVTRRDGNVVRRRVGQHFTLHEGDIDGERCAACLRDLLRHVRGQVVLLWDGLAVHRAPAVREVLKKHPRVTVYRLPGYAPELNPVEPMWAHAKGSGLRGYAPDDITDLEIEVACTLEDIGDRQTLLRSFFQATPLNVPGVT